MPIFKPKQKAVWHKSASEQINVTIIEKNGPGYKIQLPNHVRDYAYNEQLDRA